MAGVPTLAAPRPRRRVVGRRIARIAALVALAGLPAGLLAGCTSGSDQPGTTPGRSTAGAGQVDLTGLDIARAPFCHLLDEKAVEEALEGEVRETDQYVSGDKVEITRGYVDVSHEYNCTLSGRSPTQARAWIFASPVRRPGAKDLVRDAHATQRCTFPHGLRFGTPTVTAVCRDGEKEPVLRVRIQGLFGDAWLSCELTAPRTGGPPVAQQAREVRRRAEQWCSEVAAAVGSGA